MRDLTLWIFPTDHRRLVEAQSAVLLVGGYDGSGNYGDVLQLATAIETVRELPGDPLPIAIVERETLGHHLNLLARYPTALGSAVYLHYQDDGRSFDDDLVEVLPGALSGRAAVYVYGGGFLNSRWGARKVDHAAAAERLTSGSELPVVASGLQVDEAAVAPAGPAHALLARASWIGVRDVRSLEYATSHLAPTGRPRVELAGDDALPFLARPPVRSEAVVNLHLNDGIWVSEDSETLIERIASLLTGIGQLAGMSLQLQPVIAYEDPRVSERSLVTDFVERFAPRLEAAGLGPIPPIDILSDAIDNDLRRFRGARLTISCSYHVTLSSLLAGIPAVLLAQNDYYEQKALGLRNLFDLERDLVGAVGSPRDAEAAARVLGDSRERTALLAHLQAGSGEVVRRYEWGRAVARETLGEALRRPGLRRVFKRLLG